MDARHWNDLEVGMSFHSGPHTVTAETVTAYAGLTGDDAGLHTDEEAARTSVFRGRIAHGLLGTAVAHGLMYKGLGSLRTQAIALTALADWHFRTPMYVPDDLTVRCTVHTLEKDPRRARGRVTFAVEIRNGAGTVTQTGRTTLLLHTSPPGR